tara:strand:- start:258 stop:569 length:312 start_codon:yes stop_codon:yes gene_type:complete
MLEKKLVEKDVEVTVTKLEKRVFEVYTFEGEEYEANALIRKLKTKALRTFELILESCRKRNNLSPNTHFKTLLYRTDSSDIGENLEQLKSITYYYDLISELGD